MSVSHILQKILCFKYSSFSFFCQKIKQIDEYMKPQYHKSNILTMNVFFLFLTNINFSLVFKVFKLNKNYKKIYYKYRQISKFLVKLIRYVIFLKFQSKFLILYFQKYCFFLIIHLKKIYFTKYLNKSGIKYITN